MQNEPQPSVKRIYARICIIIGILGIACTYSPLILPVPWKTETKVLLVVIGGILILCSLVIKFHLLRCPYCGWGGLIPQWYRNDTYCCPKCGNRIHWEQGPVPMQGNRKDGTPICDSSFCPYLRPFCCYAAAAGRGRWRM